MKEIANRFTLEGYEFRLIKTDKTFETSGYKVKLKYIIQGRAIGKKRFIDCISSSTKEQILNQFKDRDTVWAAFVACQQALGFMNNLTRPASR